MKLNFFIATGLFVAFLIVFTMLACTNDELPLPESPAYCDTISITTYDNGIHAIINDGCAYSGCHDGAGGIGPGNFNSYAGILSYLSNGEFRNRVITAQNDPALGMPPNQSVYPESRSDELPEEDFRAIFCWLNAGYPEN